MNILEEIINILAKQIVNQMDLILLEGLEKKGYCFANRQEAEEFIKSNVTCIDMQDLSERTYYVNGEAFLFHRYKSELAIRPTAFDKVINFDGGGYTFL